MVLITHGQSVQDTPSNLLKPSDIVLAPNRAVFQDSDSNNSSIREGPFFSPINEQDHGAYCNSVPLEKNTDVTSHIYTPEEIWDFHTQDPAYFTSTLHHLWNKQDRTIPTGLCLRNDAVKQHRKIATDLIFVLFTTVLPTPVNVLPLAVNILDRFMEKNYTDPSQHKPVNIGVLGLVCFHLAHNYELENALTLASLTDFQFDYRFPQWLRYTHGEVMELHLKVLKTLEYNMDYCPIWEFIKITLRDRHRYSSKFKILVKYLTDLYCLDDRFVGFRQSICAAAIVLVARTICGQIPWTEEMVINSGGYSREFLQPLADSMVDMLHGEINANVSSLYSSGVNEYVAQSVYRWVIYGEFMIIGQWI